MKTPFAVLFAACAVVAAVTGTGAQVFRAAADVVLVDVSVQLDGKAVTDLTAADFRLFDSGIEQTVEGVDRETVPIDVTFVVDLSGSVSGPLLESLTRAIDAVRAHLRPVDQARVVTFNHRVHELAPVAAGGLPEPLALGTPAGQTSLFDALAVALIREPEVGQRRMAIVFTDGLDTTSFLDGPALVDVAKRAEAAIFTIALTTGTARTRRPAPHEALFTTLAESTGGALAVLQQNQDISDSFVQVFEQFRTSYVLSYAYQGPVRPGWHPIEVRIARRGTFEIRARQGYFRAGDTRDGD